MTLRRPAAVALLLALAACGGSPSTGGGASTGASGSVTATGPASAQVAEVKGDTNLTFVPATVNAKVGTLTLTLGNIGGTPHNLTFDDASFPKIGIVGAGSTKSATLTFTKAGTYGFTCTIHAGMAGKVVVT